VVLEALKLIDPVKPFTEATVNVIGDAVPPELTVTVAVEGDSVKSAVLAATTSIVADPREVP
jgi:hypothetical protein